MRNLLWQFTALIGVTGIGILVVVQTMQGLSNNPELASHQAVAATERKVLRASEPPVPKLPPLETTETVALADPFNANPYSQPARDTNSASEPGNPFAGPSSNDPRAPIPDNSFFPEPVPDPVESAAAVSETLQEPEPAKSATDLEPPRFPELPALIPMNSIAETPNVDVFGDPGSEEEPKASTPKLNSAAASVANDDPFADPKPMPATAKAEGIPFDPYEPDPKSEVTEEPAAESKASEESSLVAPAFPFDPETNTDDANEVPKPSAKVSNEIFLPLPEPAEKPVEELPPPEAKFPVTKAESDPFGQNPSDSVQVSPRETPGSPGRANVQVLLAPPVEDEPVGSSAPKSEPKPQESALPPIPTPAPLPADSPAAAKPRGPEVKPLPNITTPYVQGPKPPSPANGPECAVPSITMNDPYVDRATPRTAAPFVDPLDQLTFPQAVPGPAVPAGHQELVPPAPAVAGTERDGNFPLPKVTPRPFPAQPAASPISTAAAETLVEPDTGASPEMPLPSSGKQPELKIEKTAPPKAVLNQPMIYQIVVRNVGETAARQVVVEDSVPKGTKLTGTIPRGEMAENRLIWRFDAIPPGEERKISVRVIPTQEGQIGSVAKVSFVAEAAARTVVAAPRLKLELTGPSDAVLGDALTYHFELANEGSGEATKVFLRNILPEGLSHPSGSDLEYEVGTLKAGEKKGIDLTVNAAKAGQFANKAIVTANGGLKIEATTNVKILGDRISITRTGPKRRYVGRRAEYANTIVNQTEQKVSQVRVVEVVPAGMEFVKASAGGQFDPKQRTVTWALAEIGPKQNQLLTLELLAKEEGPQASQVTAFDPNGARSVVKSETTVDGYTALRLDVREYNDPIDVGEQVGIRVVATNRGTRASSNVVVKLSIPEEMEFVSAKGPVDFKRDGRSLTFDPIKAIDAGAELEFDVVLKSVQAGDARLGLEIASDQTTKPLSREEGIRILPSRP